MGNQGDWSYNKIKEQRQNHPGHYPAEKYCESHPCFIEGAEDCRKQESRQNQDGAYGEEIKLRGFMFPEQKATDNDEDGANG